MHLSKTNSPLSLHSTAIKARFAKKHLEHMVALVDPVEILEGTVRVLGAAGPHGQVYGTSTARYGGASVVYPYFWPTVVRLRLAALRTQGHVITLRHIT